MQDDTESSSQVFEENPITDRDRAWYAEYRRFVILRQTDRLAAMGYPKEPPKKDESPEVSL